MTVNPDSCLIETISLASTEEELERTNKSVPNRKRKRTEHYTKNNVKRRRNEFADDEAEHTDEDSDDESDISDSEDDEFIDDTVEDNDPSFYRQLDNDISTTNKRDIKYLEIADLPDVDY